MSLKKAFVAGSDVAVPPVGSLSEMKKPRPCQGRGLFLGLSSGTWWRLLLIAASGLADLRKDHTHVSGFQPPVRQDRFFNSVFALPAGPGRIIKGLQTFFRSNRQRWSAALACRRRVGDDIRPETSCGCFLVAYQALAPSDAVSDRVVLQRRYRPRRLVAIGHRPRRATVRFNLAQQCQFCSLRCIFGRLLWFASTALSPAAAAGHPPRLRQLSASASAAGLQLEVVFASERVRFTAPSVLPRQRRPTCCGTGFPNAFGRILTASDDSVAISWTDRPEYNMYVSKSAITLR